MTNPNAFSFGASENYWARVTTPEYQAEKRAKEAAMEAEHRRMIEAHQREQHRQAVMSQAGPAILDIVHQYLGQNRPAVSSAVKAQFLERLPGATEIEFNNALEVLEQSGHIHKLVSSTQGYMGERTYHLYPNPLEG
ncbi:hypothetical protein [Streptomyces incarnatus]|uniref:hypothetical protein n=1 Tax=Streptomyces incarnatus TaxID=665007 RepID=UPI000A56A03B|nr:hypothetical protein [Streptomyces incarnatus]